MQTANWSPLFKLSYKLIYLMLALIPVQILIFVLSPPPETVLGFFELFQEHWPLGLLSLDFLYIVNNVILMFIYAALSIKLYASQPLYAFLGLMIGLVGISAYFPTNPAFEMWTLSDQFFAAATDQKMLFLAAGENLLAHYSGTSFNVYYILNAIALYIYAFATYKSAFFSKKIGIWGLISAVFMSIPSSAGMIGMIFSLLSLIPWVVFIALLIKPFKSFSSTIKPLS